MNIPVIMRQQLRAVKVSYPALNSKKYFWYGHGKYFLFKVNIFLGMYSDNETVDVASSDETESDNDKEDNNNEENSKEKTEPEKVRSPSLSDILNLGHKNLDFLSEIYNTAFSKVPKVDFYTLKFILKILLSRFVPVMLRVFIHTTVGLGTTAV